MSNDETQDSERKLGAMITVAAIVVAAAPHAFFRPPLQLHASGEFDGFYGIAAWAPAILAGVAFFFGVEFGARRRDAKPMSGAARGTLVTVLLVMLAVVLAQVFEPKWVEMSGLRPWDELRVALPMYAGLFALQSLFWQGYVQHRTLSGLGRGPRLVAATLLPALVLMPFMLNAPTPSVLTLIGVTTLGHAATAALFEAGFAVRACMAVAAVYGAMFIWFQQAVLL